MDSVTQFALGAAMGEAVLGRRIGRLAPLLGGICGTLPDLDVFYNYGDPVSNFTYHRAATHSIFVLALAAPVIAELLRMAFRSWHAPRLGWYMLAFLALLTHPLLDCFTTYGTQVLWPLDNTPVSWSTIFIIDPAYTLPLLIGVICAFVMSRKNSARHIMNVVGIVLSTAYLGWTVYAKGVVEARAQSAIEQAEIAAERFKTIPGPFTSLFWRITAVDETSYHDVFVSLMDPDDHVDEFVSRPRNLDLLEGITDTVAVQRLVWFTRGFYKVALIGDRVAISDLRMGTEPAYAFNFKVGIRGNPHTRPLEPVEQYEIQRDLSVLGWVWQRLWATDVPPHT
jgi:inner membrane protein